MDTNDLTYQALLMKIEQFQYRIQFEGEKIDQMEAELKEHFSPALQEVKNLHVFEYFQLKERLAGLEELKEFADQRIAQEKARKFNEWVRQERTKETA